QERERAVAAESVLPVLEFIPQVKERVLADLGAFFEKLHRVSRDTTLAGDIIAWEDYAGSLPEEKEQYRPSPELLSELYSVDSELLGLSNEQTIYLLDLECSTSLQNHLREFIIPVLNKGLMSGESAREIGGQVVSLGGEHGVEQVRLSDITTMDQVLEQAGRQVVDTKFPELSGELFIGILQRYIRPNIVYNSDETDRLRRLAIQRIQPMREEGMLKGEKIIGRGERVSPEQMERLDNLRALIDSRRIDQNSYLRHDLGLYLSYLAALLLIGLYLFFYHRKTYEQIPLLLIIFFSILIVLVFSRLILGSPELSNYLVPVAICSMLVAYLVDGPVAMVCTLSLALILGVQAGLSLHTMLLAMFGGLAGAFSVHGITSRRAQYLSILYIASAYLVGIMALNYGLRGDSLSTVAQAAGWLSLNAFISTLVTVGLLPLFEYIFKITSDFTLLEWSDLNRPLLKRLSLEAPGTYHHSIILGNLAEAAAAGIGANPIYARVAAYYHDIGKMTKPEYFIENQSGKAKSNPHNKLSPKMSCLIIANHVKEGVEMARKARLPECITDVIRQHHGNSPISFFFTKEKEQNPETTLDQHDFCYPGPRPLSREAAIIMLADGVESASHVLNDPTPSRMKGLIKSIIDAKLGLGQLDETELTLKDLNRIAGEFLTILIGVHHHRIDYPAQAGDKQTDSKTRGGAASQWTRE
ncbi:MAG: HDIG domain-containing protein, partial [Gemmatimonadota bacterium]|nr:HDIG domain-containing protein [Gemmatimonadota bacterium]